MVLKFLELENQSNDIAYCYKCDVLPSYISFDLE